MNLKNLSKLVLFSGASLFPLFYFQNYSLAGIDKTAFCNNYAEIWSYPTSSSFNYSFNECMKNYRQLKNQSKKDEKSWQEYLKDLDRKNKERTKEAEREKKYLEENMENLFR